MFNFLKKLVRALTPPPTPPMSARGMEKHERDVKIIRTMLGPKITIWSDLLSKKEDDGSKRGRR